MKSPEEQAKIIYDKYEKIFIAANADSWGNEARQCTIIHVEGIVKESEKYGGFNVECEDDDGNACTPNERKEYWQQVLTILKQP